MTIFYFFQNRTRLDWDRKFSLSWVFPLVITRFLLVNSWASVDLLDWEREREREREREFLHHRPSRKTALLLLVAESVVKSAVKSASVGLSLFVTVHLARQYAYADSYVCICCLLRLRMLDWVCSTLLFWPLSISWGLVDVSEFRVASWGLVSPSHSLSASSE